MLRSITSVSEQGARSAEAFHASSVLVLDVLPSRILAHEKGQPKLALAGCVLFVESSEQPQLFAEDMGGRP